MNFLLLGEVDSGKSTLIGRLLVDSNTIHERLIEKIKKQANEIKKSSNWLAHISDTDLIEQIKGKTYSINIAEFINQGKIHKLIDCPGHKLLINEMIMSASMANVAILVISIRKGEYKSGLLQTFEHTLITRGMGIGSIIIAINKMDTIGWDHDDYKQVITDLDNRIKKFRFKKVLYVPISAYRGDNIFKRYNNALAKYSLIEALNSINITHTTTKLIKPIFYRVSGRFLFNDIENLITKGYVCKLHTHNKLFDTEIVEIKNDKLPFVTQKNHKSKPIFITLKIDTNDEIYSNVILRDGNKTIAVGMLN